MNHDNILTDGQVVSTFNETSLKTVSKLLYHKLYLVIKRVFDILISLIGCLLLIPLIIIIKIASICLGDFHSIFFVQERIGQNGKNFKLFKFRSMVLNADEILFTTLEMDKIMREEYSKNKKLKNDPRITKIGKILRKFSIDELPQFINVLKGDMSLIGNRPYLPREKKDMGFAYQEIIKTKPGLSGLWQVSGAGYETFEKRLELETFYSKKQSLKLDIKIFFKTFKAVLFGHGAGV